MGDDKNNKIKREVHLNIFYSRGKRKSGLFKTYEMVSLFEGRSELNKIALYICSDSLYLKQSLTLHSQP